MLKHAETCRKPLVDRGFPETSVMGIDDGENPRFCATSCFEPSTWCRAALLGTQGHRVLHLCFSRDMCATLGQLVHSLSIPK